MSQEVVSLLADEWAVLASLGDDLADSDWDLPTELPGWSVKDVFSHMIGTERMLLGDPAPAAPSNFGAHVKNPIGEFNEAWIAERADRSGAEVLNEFKQVTTARLAALQAMSDEEFEAEGFTPEGPGPYRKFMEIRLFDCWEHEQDIRRAVGKEGHLTGPIAERCIDKCIDSAGYVVGKKAQAPQGSTVVFNIVGPIERLVGIAVRERAERIYDIPENPDVTLTLDTATYNALACGRMSGDEALAIDVNIISGNQTIGQQVLNNLAFTI